MQQNLVRKFAARSMWNLPPSNADSPPLVRRMLTLLDSPLSEPVTTFHHQSHLGTRTQFVGSNQATPTAFDPCPPAGVPTMDFRDTHDTAPPPAVVTDERTPSK
jgi:hypothetical protein